MQFSLFDSDSPNSPSMPLLPGLSYVQHFVSAKEESELLTHIDQQVWLDELKRRVQHYGYKYDYRARKIDHSFFLGSLPDWMSLLTDRLQEQEILSFCPDQAIVNEYQPGQGISPHIDCEPCFGSIVVSLTLGSGCGMRFTEAKDRAKHTELYLEPRSLIVLAGSSRYDYLHSIPSRKSDVWKDQKINRKRRVSVTFRKVIVAN
ncbi:MAG: alpha-ketoglutarate-dependent dioxygenase AlkB [Bacteroidota bacterium]